MPVAVIWLKCDYGTNKPEVEYCSLTRRLCKYAVQIATKEEECPLEEFQLITEE